MKQKLEEEDMEKRVAICEWFCDIIEANPDIDRVPNPFSVQLWFSDETHFLLSGHANIKNNNSYSHVGGCTTEDVTFHKVHSMGCNL